MPIDFQPMQAPQAAPQAATGIDFQPMAAAAPQGAPTSPQAAPAPAAPPTTGTQVENVLKPIESAATGVVSGVMDAGRQMEALAQNLLGKGVQAEKDTLDSFMPKAVSNAAGSVTDAIGSGIGSIQKGLGNVYNSVEQGLTANPVALQSQTANPKTFGASAMLGNLGAQVAGVNAATAPVTGLLSQGIEKVAPIMASPALKGAISQGTSNAIMGAAQNPDHPVIGALVGAALGAKVGASAGAAGEQINRAGSIISDTIDDMVASGQNPSNLAQIEKIKANLADSGAIYKKFEVGEAVKNIVQEKTTQMKNDMEIEGYTPGTSPIQVLSNYTQENMKNVHATNDANWAPIENDTHTFTPTTFNPVLANLDLPKQIKLPEALPEQSTLDQMLEYRKQFDASIKQAQALARNGKITDTSMFPMYTARQALNADIHTSAQSVGLDDQLNTATAYHAENVKPFQILDKSGKYIDNPKATTAATQQILTQLQARRPNLEKIQGAASRLGPDGKKLITWGITQNAINAATPLEGEFNPSALQSRLTRLRVSGLLDSLYDDHDKDVVRGMSRAVDGAVKAGAGTVPQDGTVAKAIQGLSKSRSGIQLLKVIGSTSVPAAQTKALVTQLLAGIATKTASAGIQAIAPTSTPGNSQ